MGKPTIKEYVGYIFSRVWHFLAIDTPCIYLLFWPLRSAYSLYGAVSSQMRGPINFDHMIVDGSFPRIRLASSPAGSVLILADTNYSKRNEFYFTSHLQESLNTESRNIMKWVAASVTQSYSDEGVYRPQFWLDFWYSMSVSSEGLYNARNTPWDAKLRAIYKQRDEEQMQMVLNWLHAGGSVNARGYKWDLSTKSFVQGTGSLLVRLIHDRYFEIAKTLVYRGADVNASDEDGRTAFSWLVGWDERDLAKLLLNTGADRHIIDRSDFIIAAWLDEWDKVREYLLSGAISQENQEELTSALRFAVKAANREAVEMLLEHGAILSWNLPRPVDTSTFYFYRVHNLLTQATKRFWHDQQRQSCK